MPVFLLIIVLTLFAFPYELFIFVLNIMKGSHLWINLFIAINKFVHNSTRGGKMKNMLKAVGVLGAMAAIGGGIYLMQDKKTMKKAGKKVISAMDSAESMIAKKIN